MKRILSLVLAFALVFTLVVVPVSADAKPTAKVVASLVGDTVPAAGDKFTVAMNINEISSGLFVSGEVKFSWPTDVASLVDYYTEEPTVVTDDYSIGNVYNELVGRNGKFSYTANFDNSVNGEALAGIYIPTTARDQEAEAVDNFVMYEVAFMINEGYTYDDFYLTVLDSTLFLTADKLTYSTSVDGEIKLEGIRPAAPAIEYTDANGITYKAVSDNLITIGMDAFTNAENGGALAQWVVVDKATVDATATEGQYIHRTGENTGGAGANTMRTFFPIEGGKTYYVTNTIYNNTGAATKNQGTAGMAAIIATGDAVFGAFDSRITMYSHVTYGGYNSWSNESAPTIVGEKTGRYDIEAQVGVNKVEALINAPAEATNIMISYGAHGNNELYYGDFAIYEMEATEEIVDMVINYTDAEGNVVATETKTGAVGNTVDVAAGTTVAGADGNYMVVADATLTFVSGGSTEAVVVDKVQTVTISYTVDGVEVATGTVEGANGVEVAYNSGNVVTATGVYAKAGTIVVDAENLAVVVELDVVAEGLVSAGGQSAEAVNALEKQMTTAGTVAFDLTVLNPKDTLVALDNADVIAASGNYFGDSSAYIQLKDGSFMMNDGNGAQNVATYEVGKTYSVEFVLDVANYTYTVTVMDGETEVAKVENFGMRNDVAPIDSLVILDNAGAGAGAVVVSNLVVETEDEQPTEEVPSDVESEVPSDEESEVPSDEESEVPSDEESEVPSDEESEVPSDEESEVPSDEESEVPSDEESEVPSDDETEEPSEEPADLPYEAVDVVITPSALGVTISGKFVVVDEEYEVTDTVVVVISYLKDGKAYSVQAVEMPVINGEVAIPDSQVTLTEGELTIAGISLLTGVDALTAITTGNLGTPVGVYK